MPLQKKLDAFKADFGTYQAHATENGRRSLPFTSSRKAASSERHGKTVARSKFDHSFIF